MPDENAIDVLRFDNLEQYLLLKNGNYLYKVPFRGGFAVLKVYFCSRGRVKRIVKTFDNVVMNGQTSFMPRARLRTEQDAMKVWREAGFRVFDIYANVRVEGLPRDGYALYEYVEGRHLHKLLPDASVPMEERLAVYRRFLEQWHRRHRLAIERREPRLIHENGDLKHVLVRGDELVWFDFEMCFRSGRHIEDLVARELLAYIKSLAHFLPEDVFRIFFAETMERYPDRALLERCYTIIYRHHNLLVRAGRLLESRFGRRAAKRYSKYKLALMVRDYLASHAQPGRSPQGPGPARTNLH